MKETARIRIGNQTAFSASRIMQPFEYAVSRGFDAFEWFPDKRESGAGWTESDLSREDCLFIRDMAYENDIRLSVHAPWQANPLKPKALSFLFGSVDLAEDIGASLLNIHLYTEAGTTAYAEAILPLLERLAGTDIRLAVENTPLTGPEDFNTLFGQLFERASSHGVEVGMCLDLGHANLCNATRNDYLRYIDLLDPQVPIIHVHLHENYGDSDSHLPLFTGPSAKDDSGIKGFVDRMKKRNFSGCFIFEQWPEPPELLDRARNRLLAMIGEPEPPSLPASQPPSLPAIEGDDFAAEIAHADRQFHSWRRKLAWVHDLFEDDAVKLSTEQLVDLAIYLRFMGTGELSFAEDGGHYRPSHHAGMSRRIHERLSEMTTPENAFIIRKIYPWLPSYDNAFTRAEPLTRIRDIAHRNDIPQELKREIKTTLQNKLHRSAGPEDLVTSERLLERITAPDAPYPSAFVEEFKRFHEELREFFNARSLDEHLQKISAKGDIRTGTLIHEFFEARKKSETIEDQVKTLEILTELRARFQEELGGKNGSEAQALQLADIRLEDFSFVLLSRLINDLESLKNMPWTPVLKSLELIVRNLRMSGFDAEECRAIEAELSTQTGEFDFGDRDRWIHLKAILDRSGRLAETYCDRILTLFPERVQRLGRLLGVVEHAVRVFAEADIRSHPVFQLSKLVALLSKRIRVLASLPPWDVIVPGKVSGRLIEMSRLDESTDHFRDGAVIALLEKTEGDEEIPPGVVGILVARETPHLSHLAVRARQGGVVFAVCEEEERFSGLRSLVQSELVLEASSEAVGLEPVSESQKEKERKGGAPQARVLLPRADLSCERKLIALSEVTPETGGGKADGARRLDALSRREGADFRTPSGLVIPFGVMEESLRCAPEIRKDYYALIDRLNGLPPDDFAKALQTLQNIIEQLPVPEAVVSGVKEKFSQNERLMVRSSSNSEDLEGLAGAGLYESVANVPLSETARAVRKVWASLWTGRAAVSRKNLGIPHDKAHMAVLIQQMLVPDLLSFIMHTVNPVNANNDEVYIELAVGLGETLASGEMPGTPYRMICSKRTGSVRMTAFASFSRAVWPDPEGEGVFHQIVDYSRIELSQNKELRDRLGMRLGAVGRFVEEALGRPQDIEGLLRGETIYLVQSRPQQGRV